MKKKYLTFFMVFALLGCANSMHDRYEDSIRKSSQYMKYDRTIELSQCLSAMKNNVKWFHNNYSKSSQLLDDNEYILVERVSYAHNDYAFFYIEIKNNGYEIHTNYKNGVVVKQLESSELISPLLNALEGSAVNQEYMDTEWDDGMCYFVSIKNTNESSIYAYYSPPDILNLKEVDDVGNIVQSSELMADRIAEK